VSEWENYITSPIERFHAEAMEEFHNSAQFDVNEKIIERTKYINGIEFNRLITRFKTKIMKTYKIKSDAIYTSTPITSKHDRKIIEDAFYELMSKESMGLKESSPETYKKLKNDIQQLEQENAKLKEQLKDACEKFAYNEKYKEMFYEQNIRLKEAESVIEFYSEDTVPEFSDDYERICDEKCERALIVSKHHSVDCNLEYGLKAREYLAKYKINE